MKIANEVKTISNYSGIPMTEEELNDWKRVFIDMEENINNLYKGDNHGTDKVKSKTKKTVDKVD